jgi:hypothetical protein
MLVQTSEAASRGDDARVVCVVYVGAQASVDS